MKRHSVSRLKRLHEFDLSFLKDEFNHQSYLVGSDEAGRGCLAGPVVVAAVVLNYEKSWLDVNDSKQFTEQEREDRFSLITREAHLIRIRVIPSDVIDKINILRATEQGMDEAINPISNHAQLVLTDAMALKTSAFASKVKSIVKGDEKSACIAAASIVAKVYRDRLMKCYHTLYPQYGFHQHKGYGTKLHKQRLHDFGPCAIHRFSFAPIKHWSH